MSGRGGIGKGHPRPEPPRPPMPQLAASIGYGRGRSISQRVKELSVSGRRADVSRNCIIVIFQELLSHIFHVKALLNFYWVDSQIIRGLTQQ